MMQAFNSVEVNVLLTNENLNDYQCNNAVTKLLLLQKNKLFLFLGLSNERDNAHIVDIKDI